MGSFAQFLVKEKVLAAEQVVAALLEQMQEVPHAAALVSELAILTPPQQLEVLAYQQEHGCGYLEACRGLNLPITDICEALHAAARARRRSLSEVLLSRGIISSGDLTRVLDDYAVEMEEVRQPSEPRASNVPTNPPAQSKSVPAFTFPSFEPSLIKEYVGMLTDAKKADLNSSLASLDSVGGGCSALEAEFEAIAAAARFLGAEVASTLADAFAQTLAKCVHGEAQVSLDTLVSFGTGVIDAIWASRDALVADCSEKQAFAEAAARQEIEALLIRLEPIRNSAVAA